MGAIIGGCKPERRAARIEAGKFADLIAVAADPLADIGELERVRFVMKAGQVIRNELITHNPPGAQALGK